MNDQSNSKLDHRQLKALYESALKFLNPLGIEQSYELIVSEAKALVAADFGSLFLKCSGKLNRVFANPTILFKNQVRPKGYTYRASLKKSPSIVRVNQLEKRRPSIKDMGIKTTIYVPLVNKNESIGVLALDFLRERLSYQQEMMLLNLYANIASMAIRKAQLYKEAQHALEERDLFISLASHEIRTPLTVMLLYSELVGNSIEKGIMPQKKWSHVVIEEAKRLKKITDELLSIEQIKSGHLDYHFRHIKLNELVQQIIDEFKAVHRNKVIFENNAPANSEVVADKDKLRQVVINILNNASKYSPEESDIEVALSQKQKQVVLSIKDKGAGIKKADLNRIFDKYYQSKASDRKGLGLGLYLAKVVVEMHKGSIAVKSKLHKGTEMQIKLPKVDGRPFDYPA